MYKSKILDRVENDRKNIEARNIFITKHYKDILKFYLKCGGVEVYFSEYIMLASQEYNYDFKRVCSRIGFYAKKSKKREWEEKKLLQKDHEAHDVMMLIMEEEEQDIKDTYIFEL